MYPMITTCVFKQITISKHLLSLRFKGLFGNCAALVEVHTLSLSPVAGYTHVHVMKLWQSFSSIKTITERMCCC